MTYLLFALCLISLWLLAIKSAIANGGRSLFDKVNWYYALPIATTLALIGCLIYNLYED